MNIIKEDEVVSIKRILADFLQENEHAVGVQSNLRPALRARVDAAKKLLQRLANSADFDECWHCGKMINADDHVVEVWATTMGGDQAVLIDQMCSVCSHEGKMTTITNSVEMAEIAPFWFK